MKRIILLFFFILCARPVSAETGKKYLVVIDPVANLRSKPIDATAAYIKDDLQETQVLYNEALLYKDETADWYYVEATEQKEFTHNDTWQGYPGWIRKKCVLPVEKIPEYNIVIKEKTASVLSSPIQTSKVLFTASMGTRFNAQTSNGEFYKVALVNNQIGWINKKSVNVKGEPPPDKALIRQNLITAAKSLLGQPYLWGARGILSQKQSAGIAGGVDCSGLTSLVYRANNIDIPRDAHEQWMAAKEISVNELRPGDLIFLSKKNKFERIVHVMFYLDKETLIEAPGTSDVVSIKTFKQKFGKDSQELEKENFISTESKIYFGRIKNFDE